MSKGCMMWAQWRKARNKVFNSLPHKVSVYNYQWYQCLDYVHWPLETLKAQIHIA